ncbi:hypothetical protein PR048_005536 [Dryococelus australis]|uniref:PRELI/MSF1 domain-containing protein n=1 Tax=Dryococelus australis TaxID=614101 RepID=A0ABQ9I8I8_9NEOP|nr:hypothetical protein PR048_005536 [Dryococelus australis]
MLEDDCHPWETVAQAAWRKYPNPMNTAVIGTDVVDRKVVGGILHTHRLVSSKWGFPRWAQSMSAAKYSKTSIQEAEMWLLPESQDNKLQALFTDQPLKCGCLNTFCSSTIALRRLICKCFMPSLMQQYCDKLCSSSPTSYMSWCENHFIKSIYNVHLFCDLNTSSLSTAMAHLFQLYMDCLLLLLMSTPEITDTPDVYLLTSWVYRHSEYVLPLWSLVWERQRWCMRESEFRCHSGNAADFPMQPPGLALHGVHTKNNRFLPAGGIVPVPHSEKYNLKIRTRLYLCYSKYRWLGYSTETPIPTLYAGSGSRSRKCFRPSLYGIFYRDIQASGREHTVLKNARHLSLGARLGYVYVRLDHFFLKRHYEYQVRRSGCNSLTLRRLLQNQRNKVEIKATINSIIAALRKAVNWHACFSLCCAFVGPCIKLVYFEIRQSGKVVCSYVGELRNRVSITRDALKAPFVPRSKCACCTHIDTCARESSRKNTRVLKHTGMINKSQSYGKKVASLQGVARATVHVGWVGFSYNQQPVHHVRVFLLLAVPVSPSRDSAAVTGQTARLPSRRGRHDIFGDTRVSPSCNFTIAPFPSHVTVIGMNEFLENGTKAVMESATNNDMSDHQTWYEIWLYKATNVMMGAILAGIMVAMADSAQAFTESVVCAECPNSQNILAPSLHLSGSPARGGWAVAPARAERRDSLTAAINHHLQTSQKNGNNKVASVSAQGGGGVEGRCGTAPTVPDSSPVPAAERYTVPSSLFVPIRLPKIRTFVHCQSSSPSALTHNRLHLSALHPPVHSHHGDIIGIAHTCLRDRTQLDGLRQRLLAILLCAEYLNSQNILAPSLHLSGSPEWGGGAVTPARSRAARQLDRRYQSSMDFPVEG